MKRSKYIVSCVVALIVLSLVASTALADGELPGRTPPTLGGDIIPDAGPSPAMSYVTQYDTTPDYRFTELVGATKYKIEVYNDYDDSLVLTYKGVGVCDGGFCTLTPTTALGIYKWNSTDQWNSKTGRYYWRVKAKYGGLWQVAWSGTQFFMVLSDGFVSTFNIDMKGWKPLNGNWSLTTGSLRGVATDAFKWHSVYQKNFTYDFIYQVKMKRPVGTTMNALIYWGLPVINPSGGNDWTDGVYFQYTNLQEWSIWRTVGSTWEFVQNYTFSSYIHPYDWNTLTVIVQYPNEYYFINGGYLGWTNISNPTVGWAGVGFSANSVGERLLVDKATLEALQTYTFMVPDPAMELGKEPVPPVGDPGSMAGE